MPLRAMRHYLFSNLMDNLFLIRSILIWITPKRILIPHLNMHMKESVIEYIISNHKNTFDVCTPDGYVPPSNPIQFRHTVKCQPWSGCNNEIMHDFYSYL